MERSRHRYQCRHGLLTRLDGDSRGGSCLRSSLGGAVDPIGDLLRELAQLGVSRSRAHPLGWVSPLGCHSRPSLL